MSSFSAVRVQDQSRACESAAILHDFKIGSPEPVNTPESTEMANPVRIRALIARIQSSEPSRAYQQSVCQKLVHLILMERPFAKIHPAKNTVWMVTRSASGIPGLMRDGLPSELNVSMAHSGPLIAVAVAQGAAVGIDIEVTKPRDNFAAMAEYMGWADRVANLHDFLTCWTLWEACVKLEKTSLFNSKNAAFDALGKIERNVLAEAGDWAGLVKHVPPAVHFALAIHRDSQAPLEIKGL